VRPYTLDRIMHLAYPHPTFFLQVLFTFPQYPICQRDKCVLWMCAWNAKTFGSRVLSTSRRTLTHNSRKEVIQPQVPLRLPCYDFAPVIELAFGRWPLRRLPHGLRALPTSMA
jgi:hypothetical protein